MHSITSASLVDNGLSGLAVNTSKSSYERYDLPLTNSTVSDNNLTGVDVVATSEGDSGHGSTVHTLQFRNNVMSRNGQLLGAASYLSLEKAGGLAMRLDKSNAELQNNTVEANRGGGITFQLDSGSETSFINVSDNRIDENTDGHAIYLSGPSSGTTGARASVTNNSLSHNSVASRYAYDTLSITNVSASVTGNTFFNNTCRYVIHWNESLHSATGQHCSGNTLYQNAGQSSSSRWTILANGVAAKYNRNIFFNPSNTYEFVAGNDLKQGNHDVRNNWWGPKIASVDEAEKRVLGNSKDGFRARVDIKPIDIVNPWFNTSGNYLS